MSLLPLPTLNVSQSREPNTKLPYPELSGRSVKKKPVLQRQWGDQSQKNDAENDRLAELETMLSEAQSRAAIVEQEAYDKAYAAGEKAGLTLGEKRAEQILESMESVVAQAEQELQNLQHKSIAVIVELTDSITKRVVGDSPDDIALTLESAVKRCFSQLGIQAEQHLVLAVNPYDLDMFTRMTMIPEGLTLKVDDKVAQGSCKLLSLHQDVLIDPQGMIEKAVAHIKRQFMRMYDK